MSSDTSSGASRDSDVSNGNARSGSGGNHGSGSSSTSGSGSSDHSAGAPPIVDDASTDIAPNAAGLAPVNAGPRSTDKNDSAPSSPLPGPPPRRAVSGEPPVQKQQDEGNKHSWPSARKGDAEVSARDGHKQNDENQPRQPGKTDKARSEEAEDDVITRLHVSHLTRNVTDDHLREIFGTFGKLKAAEIVIDQHVMIARGYGFVEFLQRADADKAKLHMDGGQIDGNDIKVEFVLVPRKRSPPPRVLPRPPNQDTTNRQPPRRADDWDRRPDDRDRGRGNPLPPSYRERQNMNRRLSPRRRSPPPRRRMSPGPRFRRQFSPARRGGFRGNGGRSPPRGNGSYGPRRDRTPPRGGYPSRDMNHRRLRSPMRDRSPMRAPVRARSRSPVRAEGRGRDRSPPVRRGSAGAARGAGGRGRSRSRSRSRGRSSSSDSRGRSGSSGSQSSRSRSYSRSSSSRSGSSRSQSGSSSRSRSRSRARSPQAKTAPADKSGK